MIAPAYNRANTLAATVRSALAQTESNFELIIVDDGSTDPTPDVIKQMVSQDSRVRGLVHTGLKGPGGARNTGAAQARAPWIAFLDSDDLWRPGETHAILRRLRSLSGDS